METITKEALQELFDTLGTYKEIISALGMNPNSGGGYRTLKSYIKVFSIDTTLHAERSEILTKQRHSELGRHRIKHTIENAFNNGTYISGDILKRLITHGKLLNHNCAACGIGQIYNGQPLTLQLDHIDGDNKNNVLTNLRFMCPNCHSQTKTFGSRNRKNKTMKKNREAYWIEKNAELKEQNVELTRIVEGADWIDFTSYGWVVKVSTLINKHPQKVTKWMKRYMPDFYEAKCYKRKAPV